MSFDRKYGLAIGTLADNLRAKMPRLAEALDSIQSVVNDLFRYVSGLSSGATELVAPAITDFTNAQHDHTGAAEGGFIGPLPGPLEVASTITVVERGVISSQYSTDSSAPKVTLRKARGTRAAPATVANADLLGAVDFAGYGTQQLNRARIVGLVSAVVVADSVPTDIVFYTGDGATTAERGRIRSGGNWRILGVPVYANNAAAVTGGLGVGDVYRTGADPDFLAWVH